MLKLFDNQSGQSIIAFEPWMTQGPEVEEDPSRWFCHLTVAGQRIYRYGNSCGTCGILFKNIGAIDQRVSDAQSVKLLGSLEVVPPHANLIRLARILPPGRYYPAVLGGLVEQVEPGSSKDFFVTDVPRLFKGSAEPDGPDIPYFRFLRHHELARSGRRGGPHKALVNSMIMPLHSPRLLDRSRVEYWKRQFEQGAFPTAYAISVLDDQAPAMFPADLTYSYEEQFLIANCLIDGHHRVQAAAELGVAVRLLAFVAPEYSLIHPQGPHRVQAAAELGVPEWQLPYVAAEYSQILPEDLMPILEPFMV